MSKGRQFAIVLGLVAGLGLAVTVTAAGASAHVTVAAPGVTVGASDAQITIRVPDESATASTVAVKVQLPLDHPLAGVLVAPTPGWTAKITQSKLATPIKTDDGEITEVVSEIDWTAATGQGIQPGFFGDFTIIAGKLPDNVPALTFKAIQTYSDGKVVSWIQEPAPGSTAQPDFPAPVLQLAADTTATPTASASASPAASVSATPAASTSGASKGAATTGIVLGILGVVLGGVALLLTLRRGRRTAAD